MLTKTDLRQRLLRQRRDTAEPEKTRIDHAITDAVLRSAPFQEARTVFVYVSTDEEISTRDIIAEGLRQGKTVCVPKCLSGHRMEARVISSFDDLTEQTFGIPEPGAHCRTVPPEDIDLCLVPALACDRRGYRLGYGGGFYDRFLPLTRGTTLALCASSRVLPVLPTDCYDVPCTGILTENEVFSP